MRAIRISEWGGPEVLELVEDAPVPEPGDGQVLIRVARAGVNFADTHARENSYLARYELPLTPGRRGGGRGARAPGSASSRWSAPAATRSTSPPTRRRRSRSRTDVERRHRAGAAAAGPDRLAPVPDLGEAGRGRERRRARRGGRRRLARRPARPPHGRGPRDRDRLDARTSASSRSSLGADAAVDVGAEDLAGALIEANGGERVDAVFEMAGGRVFDESLKALAPFGRLVTYGIASREQNEVRTGALMRRSHAVVGFWLMHCLREPEMVAGPLRGAVRARRRAATCASSRARPTGCPRSAARTRTSRPAARRASSCSTRPASPTRRRT